MPATLIKADDATIAAGYHETLAQYEHKHHIVIAHGVILGFAFAIMYPLGAIFIKALSFKGLLWFHAGWQVIAYVFSLVGLGLGLYLVTAGGLQVSCNPFRRKPWFSTIRGFRMLTEWNTAQIQHRPPHYRHYCHRPHRAPPASWLDSSQSLRKHEGSFHLDLFTSLARKIRSCTGRYQRRIGHLDGSSGPDMGGHNVHGVCGDILHLVAGHGHNFQEENSSGCSQPTEIAGQG